MWLIGLILELTIGLFSQYIQLQLRSWCTKYICILNTIFTKRVQKKFTFQKMTIICGQCLIFVKKCGLSMFFMIFHCYNHIFWSNFWKSYPKMQIVDNKFTLYPKSITVLVWCQIFVVKGCFFYYKIRRLFLHGKDCVSIYKYLRGTRQLFQP